MDIALYISELLQTHNEISIPGLGTFFKKRVPAGYDEYQECYVPPAQKLEFKADYLPDHRLAEYISEQRNISMASSEHFIERFAEDIQSRLNSDHKAEIPQLGYLSKSGDNYSFAADEGLYSDNASFGLPPVKESGMPIKISSSVPPLPVLNHMPETTPADDDEPVTRKRFPVIALVVFVLLAALAAAVFYSPDTFRQLIKAPAKPSVNETVVPVTKPKTLTDSIMVADSIIQSLDQQGFEVEKPRDTLKVTTRANPVSSPNITYEIIGASLNSQADAERLVRNLKAKGIDARIILAKDKKRNNILISLGSFNSMPAASTELTRIKNDIEPGAYIYTYNKNL